MRALKLTFLLSLIPTLVFAGNIDMSGNGEDCALTRALTEGLSGIPRALCAQAVERYKQGRQTQENVTTICRGTQNVAWRRDQDNSMSDSTGKPADSMAVLLSKGGTSTAVQVCPGVYLATAHGALDNPNAAREAGRPLRDPSDQISSLIAFPMSRDTKMSVSSNTSVISPRLRDPSGWNRVEPETDYAFIKVDNAVRPNSFLTPLNYESDELLNASANGSVDVHLYRPKTRYQLGADGHPVEARNERGNMVFDESTLAEGRDLLDVFSVPQRVNRRCDLFAKDRDGLIRDNCPTETGVSGSPYSANINGEDYLLGLQVSSSGNINIDRNDERVSSGQFIMSKQFCSDFQTACGQPCNSLNETLSQQGSVSL